MLQNRSLQKYLLQWVIAALFISLQPIISRSTDFQIYSIYSWLPWSVLLWYYTKIIAPSKKLVKTSLLNDYIHHLLVLYRAIKRTKATTAPCIHSEKLKSLKRSEHPCKFSSNIVLYFYSSVGPPLEKFQDSKSCFIHRPWKARSYAILNS